MGAYVESNEEGGWGVKLEPQGRMVGGRVQRGGVGNEQWRRRRMKSNYRKGKVN